jgi:uncharacterized protein
MVNNHQSIKPNIDIFPKAFHVIAKPIGSLCNLNCTYCFYLEKQKLYPQQRNFTMSPVVLESFIRQKIEAHQTDIVSFSWQGGEPTLLGLDFFRQVVNFQQKYANGKYITNGFQTNGILLNDAWCKFFKKHNFLVGISIDGPEELSDRFRKNKGGKPTFRNIMRGISYLQDHDVDFNTLSVVHKDNSYYPLEVYHFLKEIGSLFMQFIPVVERMAENNPMDELRLVAPDYHGRAYVTHWSVKPEQYGNFLCEIFNEWVQQDVGSYFVQVFDVALCAWCGMEPGLCVFRKTCGDAMVLEHNGDLYSCDHYVYPQYKIGNILDYPLTSLINSERQKNFGRAKIDTLPKYCQECDVKFICNGECPKHRFVETPDGEEGLNYLCAGYKKFFQHIDPYMRFMANELLQGRPPANIMAMVHEM